MTTAFISYSHADEKALDRLHKHLAMLKREGALTTWTDHDILAGDDVEGAIRQELEKADIFIALVSPDYLASNYCYEKEFERAQQRHRDGTLRIVPVILEPCEWLNSPFKAFKALPKDGQPVSGYTNANNAYLEVATAIRRVLTEPTAGPAAKVKDDAPAAGFSAIRRPRIKQDFDAIDKAEYADRAFATISAYFRASCGELGQIDTLKAKHEPMDATSFTCTVVNRARRNGGEAHITMHNNKSRRMSLGDITYVFQPHAERNTSNGSISVEHDDYQLYLSLDRLGLMGGRDRPKSTPEQAAEQLWNDFVKQAGIDYGD